MREAHGNLDRAIMSDDESDRAEFDLRMIEVGAQPLRVAVKRGPKGRPPFLLFNGIGANLELAKPFLQRVEAHGSDHLRRARRRRIPRPTLPL